jgi:hypothetical protein
MQSEPKTGSASEEVWIEPVDMDLSGSDQQVEIAKEMIDSGIQAVIDWEQATVMAQEQEPSDTVH